MVLLVIAVVGIAGTAWLLAYLTAARSILADIVTAARRFSKQGQEPAETSQRPKG